MTYKSQGLKIHNIFQDYQHPLCSGHNKKYSQYLKLINNQQHIYFQSIKNNLNIVYIYFNSTLSTHHNQHSIFHFKDGYHHRRSNICHQYRNQYNQILHCLRLQELNFLNLSLMRVKRRQYIEIIPLHFLNIKSCSCGCHFVNNSLQNISDFLFYQQNDYNPLNVSKHQGQQMWAHFLQYQIQQDQNQTHHIDQRNWNFYFLNIYLDQIIIIQQINFVQRSYILNQIIKSFQANIQCTYVLIHIRYILIYLGSRCHYKDEFFSYILRIMLMKISNMNLSDRSDKSHWLQTAVKLKQQMFRSLTFYNYHLENRTLALLQNIIIIIILKIIYITAQIVIILCSIFQLQKMKKLISENIAKSNRLIGFQNSELKIDSCQALSQKSSDGKLQVLTRRKQQFRKNSKREQGTNIQSKLNKQTKSVLQQKYNSQQVSALYSQHIYKSNQRDYILESQLQKYKNLLKIEKRQKMHLLAEQNEWKKEKTKLLQEKQTILFALDSLTFKLDSEQQMKKNRDFRGQTDQINKSKLYGNQFFNNFKNNMTDSQWNDYMGIQNQDQSTWQKIKMIKNLKQKLKIRNSEQVTKVLHSHEQYEIKINEMQLIIKQANNKIEQLQQQISQQNSKQNEKNRKYIEDIQRLNLQTVALKNNITANEKQIKQKDQLNIRLNQRVKDLEETQKKANLEKSKLEQRIKNLQKQLKITQQEYNDREERQKNCIKILLKFAQDLKLSDQKIQQFLKTQIANYEQENPQDLARIKKSYNEHLSYILHLYKKKQTIYEHIVEQLKQKIKEDDFRATILQKKLNNFTKYHQTLRQLVSKQSNKEIVYRTILRFGH